jgi:hypothetical protein
MALSLILLLRQGLMSKLSNLAFRHLISPIGLSVKNGILTFSGVLLLIMG